MSDTAGLWGPYRYTVVLDGSGNGAVTFQATDKKLQITSTRVFVSDTTNEAVANIYKGNIQVEGSLAGSSGDTTDTVFYLEQGDQMSVVWTGGTPGATATAVVSGWASVPNRGFRALH